MADAGAQRNSQQSWSALAAAVYRAFPWRRAILALAIALAAHGAVYEFAPQTLNLLTRTVVPAEPVELARREELEKIPDDLLPEEFRRRPTFVPVNPEAPGATPKDESNFAAADQRAAQETPVADADSRTPTVDGELEDAHAVSDKAVPRELLPQPQAAPVPAMPTAPVTQTDVGGDESETFNLPGADIPEVETGTLVQGENAPESGEKIDEKYVPDPAPRPQISPPPGLKSVTMRSNSAVNEIGVCSLDAKYSEFGDYTQRMLEAIQAAWWISVRRTAIVQPPAVVIVEFTLCADGTIEDAHIVYSNASAAATYACLDAVESRAPFDRWRADMVAFIGKETDTTRISFHYR